MTTTTTPMIDIYPRDIDLDRRRLATTIDALIGCSQAYRACEQELRDLLAVMS